MIYSSAIIHLSPDLFRYSSVISHCRKANRRKTTFFFFYDVSDFQRSVSQSFIKNRRRSWDFVLRAFSPNTYCSLTGETWKCKIMNHSYDVALKGTFLLLKKNATVTFLLFLILGTLSCGATQERFLMCSVCVSCHWGNCHAKTLDNSHDKQKYFDKSQSLDAAEEEPSEAGTEEDPVLSVQDSGRDSDVLRLESKLLWPELCSWGRINSQAWSLT